MNYSDIKRYTMDANYEVDVQLQYLQITLKQYVEEYGCNLNPDFQRPHVWTRMQQTRYIEHRLRGGHSGKDILFNCPGWNRGNDLTDFVLVDGKQRLEAFRGWFNDEFRVFDHLYSEFEGNPRIYTGLKFHVNDLQTRAEVLQWYLDFNVGGTVHSVEEIARVQDLLAIERSKIR